MTNEASEPRQDRRVSRTRRLLNNSLMELVMEKGYDRITVQNIIDRADVGRSTFYSHFETKDDLLASGLEELTADIELHIASDPEAAGRILPSLGILRHVGENRPTFGALLGSSGIDLVTRKMLEALTDRARLAIDGGAGGPSKLPGDVRAAYLAGSLMALIRWWLDDGTSYTADELAEMYDSMTARV